MSVEENRELALSAFEEFDACRGNFANLRLWLLKYSAPEFIFHHASGIDYTGEQMIQMMSEATAAFTDSRNEHPFPFEWTKSIVNPVNLNHQLAYLCN